MLMEDKKQLIRYHDNIFRKWYRNIYNQMKVTFLSIKYALIREMLNKWTFIINIVFMIINDATFIFQWIILYSIKGKVGGYEFYQVLMLWGMAASIFGFSRFFFYKAFSLSDTITNGKLDSYLVQPKNVLISAITSEISVSAIGDMIYGFIMLFVSGITISKFILFILFSICGSIIVVDVAIILASLSFWISKSDMIADMGTSLMVNLETYPDGIFKGVARMLLFTIIPVGISTYIPVWVLTKFNVGLTVFIITYTIFATIFAFCIFYRGLKKYSSSNLMLSKI